MIRLLDIEDSAECTPSRRKKIKEESNNDVVKEDRIKRHDTDDDSLTSQIIIANHTKEGKVENDAKEHRENSTKADLEKISKDPTLSWFAGACHVWQSTEDDVEETIKFELDNKSKEKKGLWNKLSSANIFGFSSGLNIYKNFDNTSKESFIQNPTTTTKEKTKYFWHLQTKKLCDCKNRNLRSDSGGGDFFGWSNIGFSGEDSSPNKSPSQTPVVDLRKNNKTFGKKYAGRNLRINVIKSTSFKS